jgi:hypothetical protein
MELIFIVLFFIYLLPSEVQFSYIDLQKLKCKYFKKNN